MSKIICFTNRRLAGDHFYEQMEKIAKAGPDAVILREKDLTEKEYERVAIEVMKICRSNHVRCILHTYYKLAISLNADGIHMPLPLLKQMEVKYRNEFQTIGSSTHSVEEAIAAQSFGATYITIGHVFDTECKKNLAPKGVGIITDVCRHIDIPVYALGGINVTNSTSCIDAGAAGVCMMSEFMTNTKPKDFINTIKRI